MANILKNNKISSKIDKLEQFEEFARLKLEEKQLKKNRKILGAKLIAQYSDKKINTLHGKLIRTTKETWEIISKVAIIRNITQPVFNKKATLTKPQIIKAIGEIGLKKLIELGAIKLTNTTDYYKLKQK